MPAPRWTRHRVCPIDMGKLRAFSLGVLVVALALGIAQNQGLLQPAQQQLQALLEVPAVAAAVDRLRSLPLVQSLLPLLPAGAQAGCPCGVGGRVCSGLEALQWELQVQRHRTASALPARNRAAQSSIMCLVAGSGRERRQHGQPPQPGF